MAGRKTFTSGEILTAADVNSFLMDQSVMVFADSTARGSAIPSPSEGMVTYLEDSDQVQVYNGSSFTPIGTILDVKSVLKTDTFTASSVAASANVAVTGLSITHTLKNAANKLLITAYFGAAASSAQSGQCAIAVADDGTLIGVGDAAGTRTQAGAGGQTAAGSSSAVTANPSITFVYEPGDTASHTYTVRAINARNDTRNLFINRAEQDTDTGQRTRTASALVIQEIAG